MKMIRALVDPRVLSEVRDALHERGAHGMTVGEVSGFGRQTGPTEIYRGVEYTTDPVEWLEVDVVCDDDAVEPTLSAITDAAYTGVSSDGRIWVTELETLVRIRTGERGVDAL